MSGHGKNQTDRRALTSWRQQRKTLVRTRKGTDRPTSTHFLETAERGRCQDTERNRPTDAHSLSGDGRGRNLSGHGKKHINQHTHQLETVEGGTCQATERNRPTNAHSQTGGAERGNCQKIERNKPTDAHSLSRDGRARYLSGYGKKQTDRRALTLWRQYREALVRTRKRQTD